MAYRFDPLRHHWRHYPMVVYGALVAAECKTYRSHPMVGHEASKARGRMVRFQMTVRGWAKVKDAADPPSPHLRLLASIIGWRAVHKDTGEPYRVKHEQALDPVWCLEGYNKQSDPIYVAMKGNLGEDWGTTLDTVLPETEVGLDPVSRTHSDLISDVPDVPPVAGQFSAGDEWLFGSLI